MMPLRGRAERLLGREPSLAVAFGIALLAVAARLPGAIGYPLWQDEVASARILVEPTPWAAVERVVNTESTPLLWYVLGWLLHHAGVPVVGVRALSVLCGGALAALVVLYARRFLPLAAAALAGVAAALGWQFVYHGRELRAYALFALLALAFAWLLERAAERPALGRLAALAVVVAGGALTHYFFLLTIGTGLLWIWTSSAGAAARRRVSVAIALALVPFLAWLPGIIEQAEDSRLDWVAGFSVLKAAYLYSTLFASAGPLYVQDHPVDIGIAEAVGRFAVMGVVLAGAVVLFRRPGSARLCALLATAPMAAGVVLWAVGAQIFTTRNFLGAAPFVCVAVAAAAATLPRPLALASGGVAAGLLLAGYAQERVLAPPPYDEAAAAIVQEGWAPEDPIAVVGGAHSLFYLGDVHAIQSPLGWYLPGHPQLRAVTPSTTCASLYLVAPSSSGARLLAPPALNSTATAAKGVGSLIVAPLSCRSGLDRALAAAGARWFRLPPTP
jgi:hypothetical protein